MERARGNIDSCRQLYRRCFTRHFEGPGASESMCLVRDPWRHMVSQSSNLIPAEEFVLASATRDCHAYDPRT